MPDDSLKPTPDPVDAATAHAAELEDTAAELRRVYAELREAEQAAETVRRQALDEAIGCVRLFGDNQASHPFGQAMTNAIVRRLEDLRDGCASTDNTVTSLEALRDQPQEGTRTKA